METDARDSGDGCRPEAARAGKKRVACKGRKATRMGRSGQTAAVLSVGPARVGRALAFMLTMTSAHTRNGVDGVESAPHFLTAS